MIVCNEPVNGSEPKALNIKATKLVGNYLRDRKRACKQRVIKLIW